MPQKILMRVRHLRHIHLPAFRPTTRKFGVTTSIFGYISSCIRVWRKIWGLRLQRHAHGGVVGAGPWSKIFGACNWVIWRCEKIFVDFPMVRSAEIPLKANLATCKRNLLNVGAFTEGIWGSCWVLESENKKFQKNFSYPCIGLNIIFLGSQDPK